MTATPIVIGYTKRRCQRFTRASFPWSAGTSLSPGGRGHHWARLGHGDQVTWEALLQQLRRIHSPTD